LEDARAGALDDQGLLARQLLSAVGQAVIGSDLAGTVIFWNRGAEQVYGWSEQEALGARIGDLLVPVDRTADATEIMASVLAGESWTGEFPVRHRDGHLVRALVTDSAIRNEADEIVGIIGVSTDISERTEMERSLRRSEERLLARFEQSEMPQLAVDVQGRIAAVNGALCRLLESAAARLIGESLFELLTPAHPAHDGPGPEASPLEAMLQQGRTSLRAECTAVTGQGTPLVLQLDLTVLRDADGNPYAFDGHVQDLSELRRMEQALRLSEARIRVIADAAQEGIWAVDLDGRALYANQMTADLLRRDLSDVYSSTPAELLRLDPALVADRVRGARAGGAKQFDDVYVAPDGERRVLRVSVADLPDPAGRRIVGVLLMISDVTDVRAAQEELTRKALEDPLTGLGNRTLLLDRLGHAMHRAARSPAQVAVLFVDLDHLKEVNDACGHAEGDELLREVGRRISRSVRPGDTVARFGGDEFVVLCEDIHERAARDIADRLLTVLAEPAQLSSGTHVPSASIGLALSPTSEPDVLLNEADAAMYEAKRLGRGRVVVRVG
jgi:diguanylate cyclase (GGDEF)-like protein/PAS domain S-box-containing protein